MTTRHLPLANSMAELLAINDLKDICFALQIDFSGVESETVRMTALNLIDWCEQHAVLPALLAAYRQLRPQAAYWAEHP